MENKFTVGFIGAGNMGGALLAAAAKSERVDKIFVSDKNAAMAQNAAENSGAEITDNKTLAQNCDYIFLGVKPNIVSSVMEEISPVLEKRDGYVLISMAAGVKIADICKYGDFPVIRIMPNTPVSIGKGMILYSANNNVSSNGVDGFLAVLNNAGILDCLDEKLIDAAGALTGCGPAFVYMFIEALADGAVYCGLPRDKAVKYAAQTVAGAAENVLVSEKHSEALKDAVCSPAGTTIAGVHALENGKFRANAMNAVISAYDKTLKLNS